MQTAKLKKKKRYDMSSPLKEDEYLLRVENEISYRTNIKKSIGFLSKLNKTGKINKNFTKWRNWNNHEEGNRSDNELDIMVHKETFAKGWKFISFRGGESQDWARLQHPLGFELEVYINTFIDMVQDITIINGELQGKFKWSYSKLIQE
jgi:hypothetical protein